ncbi:MAG TPA: winged helix-turn-helix domain-containing protein [Bryobacteraceae bacterium]|jgi:TolB-like protein/Tfp pilus assembly protein PilF
MVGARVFEFGEFRLDCDRFELSRAGRNLKLERKPLELLILLATRNGHLVTRADIADQLWGREVFVDIEHGINTAVRKVRQALREHPEQPRFLETVPGKGYRFLADVIVSSNCAGANAGGNQVSIAVLPFANMSAEKEDEYFGDGLAEEIINQLANVPRMKVAARTSSFFFKGKDVDAAEIGKRLNVEHVLEGSVRRSGNRVRIMMQLIKLSDGFHLWSERYDREITDIFAVQDEITNHVIEALRIKLSPRAVTPRRYVPNFRAYEAYLKARNLWFSRAGPQWLARFKELLERAIELDPKFALAHSFLGMYYTMQASVGLKAPHDVIPSALAAEREALQVDPSLPEAHALLGVCTGEYEHDWSKAERHWRLALSSEPLSRDVVFWYGNHFLLPIGRTQEAIDSMERGLQGDPLNLLYRHHYARGLRLAGKLGETEMELRNILEIDEEVPYALGTLGSLCAQQGRYDDALELTERAHNLVPWSASLIGQLAAMLIRTGAQSRAEALIDTLKSGAAYRTPTGILVFHLLCGQFEAAEEWAELAVEQRDMQLIQNVGVFLRQTSWWPRLAKRMNVADCARY